jgi:hypothetical protein
MLSCHDIHTIHTYIGPSIQKLLEGIHMQVHSRKGDVISIHFYKVEKIIRNTQLILYTNLECTICNHLRISG